MVRPRVSLSPWLTLLLLLSLSLLLYVQGAPGGGDGRRKSEANAAHAAAGRIPRHGAACGDSADVKVRPVHSRCCWLCGAPAGSGVCADVCSRGRAVALRVCLFTEG